MNADISENTNMERHRKMHATFIKFLLQFPVLLITL